MRHIFTAPDRWVLFYRFAVAVKSLWKKAVFKFHFLFAWQAKPKPALFSGRFAYNVRHRSRQVECCGLTDGIKETARYGCNLQFSHQRMPGFFLRHALGIGRLAPADRQEYFFHKRDPVFVPEGTGYTGRQPKFRIEIKGIQC